VSICPFYDNGCILKPQANLPDFKNQNDCKGIVQCCSFFIKEKLKQLKVALPLKIIIRKVDDVFLVKADAIIYPTNNLLESDSLLKKHTKNEIDKKNVEILKKGIKMGFPYSLEVPIHWNIKQKYFINAVVAGESRLVNESDMQSAMKKSLLLADYLKLTSVVVLPSDFGIHDIGLTSLNQISSIFLFCKQHKFEHLKHVFICMTDEETEQSFIEYYNRIFGGKIEPRNDAHTSVDNKSS